MIEKIDDLTTELVNIVLQHARTTFEQVIDDKNNPHLASVTADTLALTASIRLVSLVVANCVSHGLPPGTPREKFVEVQQEVLEQVMAVAQQVAGKHVPDGDILILDLGKKE